MVVFVVTDTQVTDPEIIDQLERYEPPEGEDASIDRPVDLDKLDPVLRKELQTRLKRAKRGGG